VPELTILFGVVFLLNIIPAFAPPTWMALSWVGFRYPLVNLFAVALVASLAATCGRLVLAKMSRVIIRQRFMSDAMRGNIDVVKAGIERHRTLTFSAFLVYAFSPLPSNYLFIAYGLTSLPLWLAALPFFVGRCVSYAFFALAASQVSQHLALDVTETQPFFGIYFVISQLLLLGLVVALMRIDWSHLVAAKRFRWLRPEAARPL